MSGDETYIRFYHFKLKEWLLNRSELLTPLHGHSALSIYWARCLAGYSIENVEEANHNTWRRSAYTLMERYLDRCALSNVSLGFNDPLVELHTLYFENVVSYYLA